MKMIAAFKYKVPQNILLLCTCKLQLSQLSYM